MLSINLDFFRSTRQKGITMAALRQINVTRSQPHFERDVDFGTNYLAINIDSFSHKGERPLYWRFGNNFPPEVELKLGDDGEFEGVSVIIHSKIEIQTKNASRDLVLRERPQMLPVFSVLEWSSSSVHDQAMTIAAWWTGDDLWIVNVDDVPKSSFNVQGLARVLFNDKEEVVGVTVRVMSHEEKKRINSSAQKSHKTYW